MAGHSRQFTPGGLPDNCETHCVSGNRTHDHPIVSPTRYQLCHRDHQRRLASLQDQKFISKTVATVDNLCMVDHVKFVMHFKEFMACCNIIIAKYWGPGRRAPGLMYIRHRMSQERSTDTSDRIHYSLLQCNYLPVNVRCLRDSISFQSLAAAAIRGPRLKLLL